MDEKGKKIVKRALDEKRDDEQFYEALSRVLSEKIDGKKGYSLYLKLIKEIRKFARDKEVSVVKGAEIMVTEE